MQPKHSAIVAGLTLALSFGAVSAPAPAAAEEPTPGVASDATDIDKVRVSTPSSPSQAC